MPVRFDEYDPDENRIDLSEGTNANRILSFLLENPEYGFTPKEIHEATDVAQGSVSPTLLRLEDHGLVRHKGDQWAAASDEKIAAYQSTHVSLDAIADRHSDDWYGNNPDWDEEIEDIRDRDE